MSDIKTVLIVDDSRVSRMMIRSMILAQHPDWVMEEAVSGEEALEKIRTIIPHLITLDINMPGMGGLAAAEELVKECPNVKIVLLTGNIQASSHRKAEQLGVGFVEKPITESCVARVLAYMDQ
ncbi:MAG: response regulator [Sulfuricellaceae bacterium]